MQFYTLLSFSAQSAAPKAELRRQLGRHPKGSAKIAGELIGLAQGFLGFMGCRVMRLRKRRSFEGAGLLCRWL